MTLESLVFGWVIAKYGIGTEINHTCISTMLDEENIEQTVEDIRGFLDRTGTAGRAMLHGPYTEVFPQAIDPMMAAASKKRLDQAAYCAMQVGVKRMVVHSGYIPFVYFPENATLTVESYECEDSIIWLKEQFA